MKKLLEVTQRFLQDEEGGETVEYALILALIAVASIIAYKSVATATNTTLGVVAGQMPGTPTP